MKFIAPGFDPSAQQVAVSLTRFALPSVILSLWVAVLTGVLQFERRFTATGLIGLPFNVILIAGPLLFAQRYGVYAVAVATVFAYASQVVIQVPSLAKAKLRYRPSSMLFSPAVRQGIKLMIPTLFSIGAQQVATVVDRMLASGLTEGAISALNYANRLIALPTGVLGTSIATAQYPSLAKMAAEGDHEGFAHQFWRGTLMSTFLIMPVAITMIVLRVDIVKLVFQHGAFGATATVQTAYALLFFSISIVPSGIREVATRAFFALQDTRTPMWTGLMGIAVNIVGNLLLVHSMAHGGLALATSLSVLIQAGAMIIVLQRRGCRCPEEVKKDFGKMFFSCLPMVFISYSWSLVSASVVPSHGQLGVLANFSANVVVSTLFYLLAALVLQQTEAKILLSALRRFTAATTR